MKSRWIQPNGDEEQHELDQEPTFTDMQKFVGGHIEIVNVLYQDKACHMIVHEEGMILQLPVNEVATEIYHAASKARGVDPLNPTDLKKDREDHYNNMAKNLGIERSALKVVELGLTLLPPMIYGPAIVFEGLLT